MRNDRCNAPYITINNIKVFSCMAINKSKKEEFYFSLIYKLNNLKKTKEIDCSSLPNEPEFNKWDNIIELGWPKCLYYSSLWLKIAEQVKVTLLRTKICSGNKHRTLDPFTTTVVNTWSYMEQPHNSYFSINYPTGKRFLKSPGDIKALLKVGAISPTKLMIELFPLTTWIYYEWW